MGFIAPGRKFFFIHYATVTVVTGNSTLALGASSNYTATVTNLIAGGPVPKGTITWYDEGAYLQSYTLNSSAQSSHFYYAGSSGNRSLSAVFTPESTSWVTSTGYKNVTVPYSTSTGVSGSNLVYYGQVYQYTATVSSAGGTPTGSVDWYFNGSYTATTSLSGGSTSYNWTATYGSGNPHSIQAYYSGDTAWSASNGSTSATGEYTTSTTISSLTGSVHYATPAILEAIVSGVGAGYSVLFYIDGGYIGSANTNSSGYAYYSPNTSPSIGSHSIEAHFVHVSGVYAASVGTGSYDVTKNDVTISISSTSPEVTLYAQDFNITVAISNSSTDYGLGFTGDYRLYADGVLKATKSVSNSSGDTFSITENMAIGTNSWTADTVANANFNAASTSAGVNHEIRKQDSYVLAANPSPTGSIGDPAIKGFSFSINGDVDFDFIPENARVFITYTDSGNNDWTFMTANVVNGAYSNSHTFPPCLSGAGSLKIEFEGAANTNASGVNSSTSYTISPFYCGGG